MRSDVTGLPTTTAAEATAGPFLPPSVFFLPTFEFRPKREGFQGKQLVSSGQQIHCHAEHGDGTQEVQKDRHFSEKPFRARVGRATICRRTTCALCVWSKPRARACCGFQADTPRPFGFSGKNGKTAEWTSLEGSRHSTATLYIHNSFICHYFFYDFCHYFFYDFVRSSSEGSLSSDGRAGRVSSEARPCDLCHARHAGAGREGGSSDARPDMCGPPREAFREVLDNLFVRG